MDPALEPFMIRHRFTSAAVFALTEMAKSDAETDGYRKIEPFTC